jgi:small redox-active disulfide protein 2
MNIKVLGSGCPNCRTLEHRTRDAATALHLEVSVEKVQDIQQIVSYGIMRTPGLVIDGHVVLAGSVPTVDELKSILQRHASLPQAG